MFIRSPLILIGSALMIAFPCIALVGCKGKQPDSAPAPTASVAPVARGDLSSTLTVAGAFQPYQEVDLHAKVSGYVRHINVDIGDRVRAGQVIATLEVPELNAQVAAAQAQIRRSKSEIARAQNSVTLAEADEAALHAAYVRLSEASARRPGLIAAQELDDARAKDQDGEAKINVAKSALEAAQEQLGVSQAENQRVKSLEDYAVVTAPFNGVVTMRYADVGSLIQAGTTSDTQSMPVVKLAQSDLLRLRMPVPEEDVPFIRNGGEVQIKLQATGKTIAGKIIRFTRELTASTRTMLAEVDVPNQDLALSAGMTAEAAIVLQGQKNVLIVPAGAVIKGDTQPYVLVVDANNHVQRKSVTTGIQAPDRVEVVQGLTEHERVIVSGQENYQPGETVRPQLSTISMPQQGGNQ